MSTLISESGLMAAEDAYDAIATGSYEQINRRALEEAIRAYLAVSPRPLLDDIKRRLESYAALDDEDKRSESGEDRAYHQGRAAGLRMAAGYL